MRGRRSGRGTVLRLQIATARARRGGRASRRSSRLRNRAAGRTTAARRAHRATRRSRRSTAKRCVISRSPGPIAPGELERRGGPEPRRQSFEATPLLVDDKLIVCTPYGRVIALDPVTGREQWVFDPNPAGEIKPAPLMPKCRGVATFLDRTAPADAPCRTARSSMATGNSASTQSTCATASRCAGLWPQRRGRARCRQAAGDGRRDPDRHAARDRRRRRRVRHR